MMHGVGWMAVTTSVLLIREAGSLVHRALAYRQQRWIVENAKQVTSEGRSVEITGLDRITISSDPDRSA
jgi:hypothetical protein